ADIIRTIVALGRSQKVEVIAEYVETLEQRMMLADLGCDIFQGYFHSPALSEGHCIAYFAKSHTVQAEAHRVEWVEI
ncbi:EAL domain-containing protein, partial [Rhodoferax saidenbachensis]